MRKMKDWIFQLSFVDVWRRLALFVSGFDGSLYISSLPWPIDTDQSPFKELRTEGFFFYIPTVFFFLVWCFNTPYGILGRVSLSLSALFSLSFLSLSLFRLFQLFPFHNFLSRISFSDIFSLFSLPQTRERERRAQTKSISSKATTEEIRKECEG